MTLPTDELLVALLAESRRITKSLGIIALRLSPSKPRTDAERARVLKAIGFDNAETAALLGISPDAVRARLSESSPTKKRKRGDRAKG